jgi:predicted nucleic acid-binding protein
MLANWNGVSLVTDMVILDTDILIDAGRGVPESVTFLKKITRDSQPAISVVTQMELIVGCRNKIELGHLDKFLQQFQIIKVSEPICDRAIDLIKRYRLSHGLMIADSLIAATALHIQQPFITKNQRDYQFIDSLRLLPYPILP